MLKTCKVHGSVEAKISKDGRGYKYLVCPLCMKKNSDVYKNKHRLRMLLGKAKLRIKWDFNIDEAYLKEIEQNQKGLCALTGTPLKTYSSIDRIDSKKGYIKGNIQLILTVVNRMKRDIPQDIFIKICKDIARNNNDL